MREGAIVVGHDPEAAQGFLKAIGGRVKIVDRDYDATDGADALVLLTEWRSYRAPNFRDIKKRMNANAVIVDARNVWRPAEVLRAGLRYVGVGVPTPDVASLPAASSPRLPPEPRDRG